MNGVSNLYVTEDVTLVTFNNIPIGTGLMVDIFYQFAANKINIDMISQTSPVKGTVSISFTCADSDMIQVLEITKNLGETNPKIKPMVSSGNCKLQVYGEEMRNFSGVFAGVIAALANTGVEVQQITTSEVEVSLLITAPYLNKATAALEKAFGLA